MTWLHSFCSRCLALLRGGRLDREMAAEMEAHLAFEIERNEARGMSRREARCAALRSFGGVEQIKEREREVRSFRWVEDFARDLRYGLRRLLRKRGSTAVVALTLGLGIGASTTVYAWFQAVLLAPLPGVERQDEIVALLRLQGTNPAPTHTLNLPTIHDLGGLTDVFAGVVGSIESPACGQVEGRPVWLYGQLATSNFFDVLGVRPILGQTFAVTGDEVLGGQPAMVLSEACWRRVFGADPQVVGRTLEVNRQLFTIIGVAPAEFGGAMTGLHCDFWAPIEMCQALTQSGSLESRWGGWLHTQARLRPGVSLAQAQSAVDGLMRRLEETYPRQHAEVGTRLVPLREAPYGAQALLGPVLHLLLAVAAFLLLIVIANVANLQLVQAVARRREIAVRLATGATRGAIIRQFLTESLLLGLLGCAAGLFLSIWAVDLLAQLLPITGLPVAALGRLDGPVVAFGFAVALATALFFGLVPAWQAARCQPNAVLKESGRTTAGGVGHQRLRSLFAVVQIALAVSLTISAGLCVRGMWAARQTPLGLDPAQTVLGELHLGMHGYTPAEARLWGERLLADLEGQPGVEAAALASWVPLGFDGPRGVGIFIDGYARAPGEDTTVHRAIVSPSYFETLRVPIVEGRGFATSDTPESPPVAVINQAMAARFWPDGSAVGRTLRAWNWEFRVVGVVPTGKYFALEEAAQPFLFISSTQGLLGDDLQVLVRGQGELGPLYDLLRQRARALDPAVELRTIRPLGEHVAGAFFAQRVAMGLLAALGGLAVLLAALGIFAVVAHQVAQQTREIGLRMAVGARPREILGMVLGRGVRLAGLGLLVGGGGALVGARFLGHFLHGVSPLDPLVLAVAVTAVLLVTVLACLGPAWRAAQLDPMAALRTE